MYRQKMEEERKKLAASDIWDWRVKSLDLIQETQKGQNSKNVDRSFGKRKIITILSKPGISNDPIYTKEQLTGIWPKKGKAGEHKKKKLSDDQEEDYNYVEFVEPDSVHSVPKSGTDLLLEELFNRSESASVSESNTSLKNMPSTIWQLPSPEIIKEMMKCQICGQIGAPPNFQCTKGHLSCQSHYEMPVEFYWRDIQQNGPNGGMAEPKDEYSIHLKQCPVQFLDNDGWTKPCNADLFEGNLELYTTLWYNCCERIIESPSESAELEDVQVEDCELKLAGLQLNNSNSYKEVNCPNSYCGKIIQSNLLLEHLAKEHSVPLVKGESVEVKIMYDGFKHKNAIPVKYFCWIGAIVQYSSYNFMLVIHEQEEYLHLWLHQIQPDKDEELSGIPTNNELQLQQSEIDNLTCTLKFKNSETGLEEVFTDQIVTSFEEKLTSGFNKGKHCKLYTEMLQDRYVFVEEEVPCWNMKVELSQVKSE